MDGVTMTAIIALSVIAFIIGHEAIQATLNPTHSEE
jgi:hypothetical protein